MGSIRGRKVMRKVKKMRKRRSLRGRRSTDITQTNLRLY